VNALLTAVAASIVAEVSGAGSWTVKKTDLMWRNPESGKVLNVFLGREIPGLPRWTGGAIDLVEVIVEYAEPAPENTQELDHDETAEFAANDVARSLRTWALSHEDGFSPAYKMDWTGTEYTPQVRRELFVRYCRVTFQFEVVVSYV
jgi:hypothetical protein